MKCKKNWFYGLCVLLLTFFLLYAFWCSFTVQSQNYVVPSLFRAELFLVLFAGLAGAGFWAWLSAFLGLERIFAGKKKWVAVLEAVLVVAVLAAAVFLRIRAVSGSFHTLGGQELLYYEIAGLQKQGTLLSQGAQYCDLIAKNPNLLGYSFFLKTAFSIWGIRMEAGQYLNIFFSVSAVFFLYVTARKLGGRIAGVTALLLGAFSPELVAGVLVLSGDTAFLFFAFGGSALLAHLLTDYDKDRGKAGVCFSLCILLGAFLAVGAMVNPLLVLFMAAVFLVLFFQKMELPNKPINDIPLILRFIHHGWVRCLLILAPFILLYTILLSNVEMAINRDVALVGGLTWEKVSELTVKYERFWGSGDFCGLWGAVLLFWGLLGLQALLQSGGSFLYIYALWFLGSLGGSLFLETETRLPGTISFLLILFAAHGLESLFRKAVETERGRVCRQELSKKQEEERQAELGIYKKAEEEVEKLRAEALANVFDMQYALENGHVIMTVSEAYRQEKTQKEEKTASETEPENLQKEEKKVSETEQEDPAKEDSSEDGVKTGKTGA